MYLATATAGWNSIQGRSVLRRAPHSYPVSSLCKNYEKNDVPYPKFKQNTSFSLFSFLIWEGKLGGKCWQREKKIWSQEKINIVSFFKFSCSLNLFTCVHACSHMHNIFICCIYIDTYLINIAKILLWILL